MGLEIEKKYLLKSADILHTMREDGVSPEKQIIIQFYTQINKKQEIRYRKKNSHFIKTIKNGEGLVRKEDENEVDENTYNEAKKSQIGNTIDKTRYTFKIHNFPCCIDIYNDTLEGLYILEVEFPNEQTAHTFTLPFAFEQQVIEEVTSNEAYKNKNLAQFGLPTQSKEKNTQEIFNDIKKEPFTIEPHQFLQSNLNSYDAMRIIFYSLLQKVLFYKGEFLREKKSEDLHQLRVNIRKTRSLLQSVEDIFEQNIAQRFIDDFKSIANETNTKRDTDVFIEYLEGLDEVEAEVLLEVFETQEDTQSVSICRMLEDEEFNRIIQEWEFVLNDKDGFFKGTHANLDLKKTAALSLTKRLQRMEKRLSVLDESTNLRVFHKVRIEFKRLRYLSEYFTSLFEEKSIVNMISVSKKMQTMFGELQDRDVGLEILDSLENSSGYSESVEIVYSISQIIDLIKDDIYNLRTKILMRKNRLFQTLEESINILETYNKN